MNQQAIWEDDNGSDTPHAGGAPTGLRPQFAELGLEILLWGLQSPINIGIVLRIAEAYQFHVSLHDPHGVLDDPQRLSTARDFACGAMSRRTINRIADRAELARLCLGRRLVATAAGGNAQPLPGFRFHPGDVIALGNEYDGLPAEIVDGAAALIQVPTPAVWMPKERSRSPIDPGRAAPVSRDGQACLNVAVTAGIVCYAAYADWLERGSAGAKPPELSRPVASRS
jgi:tRNA(Leu) C34 or U34 (ribose-2'-O)-methylase TrmL